MSTSKTEARTYCAEVAIREDTSLIGTAIHVECWLLIEYPGTWKPNAVDESNLETDVHAALERLVVEANAQDIRLRVQFIKQGNTATTQPRLVFADTREGHNQLAQAVLENYADITNLTFTDLLGMGELSWQVLDDEIYLICTNGQRDVCCARLGLPLYDTLRQEFGHQIWQTTHLGGHRYAPNLLCLPSGYLYGFVFPDQGKDVVKAHNTGNLTTGLLRGRCSYPAHRQAGEIYARIEHQAHRFGEISCDGDIENSEQEAEHYVVPYSGSHQGQIALHKASRILPTSSCDKKPAKTVIFTRT